MAVISPARKPIFDVIHRQRSAGPRHAEARDLQHHIPGRNSGRAAGHHLVRAQHLTDNPRNRHLITRRHRLQAAIAQNPVKWSPIRTSSSRRCEI